MLSTIVPDYKRTDFIPTLFGVRNLMRAENTVYYFMDNLSPDYGGGFWNFYEVDNGARYMAPAHDKPMKLSWDGNGFEGEASPETAGIIATLFALSYFQHGDEYHLLLDYASTRDDAALIYQAID